ncbi:hypothetical protein BDZ89DRAFT_785959 [Hymenopellis radicata]|nr:hypothetical protein BDZ89DRAFT_785959 [Hymenopellis radicata]
MYDILDQLRHHAERTTIYPRHARLKEYNLRGSADEEKQSRYLGTSFQKLEYDNASEASYSFWRGRVIPRMLSLPGLKRRRRCVYLGEYFGRVWPLQASIVGTLTALGRSTLQYRRSRLLTGTASCNHKITIFNAPSYLPYSSLLRCCSHSRPSSHFSLRPTRTARRGLSLQPRASFVCVGTSNLTR